MNLKNSSDNVYLTSKMKVVTIPQEFMMTVQHAQLAERIEGIEQCLKQFTKEQYHAGVKFVSDEESPELFTPKNQIIEENERLREENARLRSLLQNDAPHVRLFRTAVIVFSLCALSFLSWLWLNIELIHPFFAVLGMVASVGFMSMARVAWKLREKDTDPQQ